MSARIELDSLNSLSLLSKRDLKEDDLPLGVKERLKEAFSHVLNDPRVAPHIDVSRPFDFQIKEGRGFLIRTGLGWRQIVPFSSLIRGNSPFTRLYRQIQEVEKIAKRIGGGPTKREKAIEAIAQGRFKKRDQKPDKPPSRLREYNACVIDGNSFWRNSTSALVQIPTFPANAATALMKGVAGSSILGGALAFGQGLLITRSAGKDGLRALRYGDWEGGIQAAFTGIDGMAYASVGAAMTITTSASFAQNAALTASAGFATSICGMIMNGGIVALSANGWKITHDFRKELKEILSESNEPKRLYTALRWIQNQVALSEWEMMEIRQTTSSPQEALKLMGKRIQKKWDQFERRTNSTCGEFLRKLTNFEELLRGVEAGDAAALQKAEEIVYEVEKANYQERVKYKFFTLVGIIGFIASLLSLLFPLLAPVGFAIAALLWFTIDSRAVQNVVMKWRWEKHLEQEPRLRYNRV